MSIPILGNIPYLNIFEGLRGTDKNIIDSIKEEDIFSANDDESTQKQKRYELFFYKEAFRNLFTSIRFLNSDKPIKTIAITSSLPKEGKSLVIILLAKTLAEIGSRVILIDSDIRKPQVHSRLGLNNLVGLSNLLIDKSKTWKDIKSSVKGIDNFDVITAGRNVPDPTRLLSSNRMKEIVENISQEGDYDLILFDTPPILGISDAALVSEYCDGLIIIVSMNNVEQKLPLLAINRLKVSGSPLLGVIANNSVKASGNLSQDYTSYESYGGYASSGYVENEKLKKELESKEEERSLKEKLLTETKLKIKQLISWLDN